MPDVTMHHPAVPFSVFAYQSFCLLLKLSKPSWRKFR